MCTNYNSYTITDVSNTIIFTYSPLYFITSFINDGFTDTTINKLGNLTRSNWYSVNSLLSKTIIESSTVVKTISQTVLKPKESINNSILSLLTFTGIYISETSNIKIYENACRSQRDKLTMIHTNTIGPSIIETSVAKITMRDINFTNPSVMEIPTIIQTFTLSQTILDSTATELLSSFSCITTYEIGYEIGRTQVPSLTYQREKMATLGIIDTQSITIYIEPTPSQSIPPSSKSFKFSSSISSLPSGSISFTLTLTLTYSLSEGLTASYTIVNGSLTQTEFVYDFIFTRSTITHVPIYIIIDDETEDDDNPWTPGLVIGLATGLSAIIFILLGMVVFLYRKNRENFEDHSEEEDDFDNDSLSDGTNFNEPVGKIVLTEKPGDIDADDGWLD